MPWLAVAKPEFFGAVGGRGGGAGASIIVCYIKLCAAVKTPMLNLKLEVQTIMISEYTQILSFLPFWRPSYLLLLVPAHHAFCDPGLFRQNCCWISALQPTRPRAHSSFRARASHFTWRGLLIIQPVCIYILHIVYVLYMYVNLYTRSPAEYWCMLG